MAAISSPGSGPSVKVFGSAVVRVTPDSATVVVTVSRLEPKPAAAFAKARAGAQAVNAYLARAGVTDVGSSRINLSQESRFTGNERQFLGYRARIVFNVILRELDKLEAVLTEVIAAGANELESVTFETTRLKDFRADARRRAVAAAREKAELYCQAAGVTAGNVLVIEDVNPESLSGYRESHTHDSSDEESSDEQGAIDPGAIPIRAAVNVVYQIELT